VAVLDTTVAVYRERSEAESDWSALEAAADQGLEIADAALVENRGGEALILERQSHHGWGKGAIVGAIVGVLFPPSILGAAVVGAGGGALIARMTRSLGRGQVKDLGETIDSGAVAIIAVTPSGSTNALCNTLATATTTTTVPSATDDEIKAIIDQVR
jgi:uncharacterized membrane protein